MPGELPLYAFRSFRVDPARRSLSRDGAPVRVTAKVFDLLIALLQNRDRVVTRDELMSQLWPDTIVEDGNLSVNVSALRKALDDDRTAAPVIETLPRIGYRFVAETEESKPEPTVARSPRPEAAAADAMSPVPFVGRDHQMGTLHELFEGVLGGGGGKLVFIHGEPGIGKTTLSEHFIASVASRARDVRVMVGRCLQQHGAGEAYLPFITAFSDVLAEPGAESLRRLFSERAPSWCRYLPAIFGPASEAASSGAPAASGPQFLREAYEVVTAMAQVAPLLVLMEDLHWADPSSVDLLRLLSQLPRRDASGRALAASPWLVLGTFRAAEVWAPHAHPLAVLLRELRMHDQCTELALNVLDTESVARYLDDRFGAHEFPPELGALLLQKTCGHPLLFTRLLEWFVTREDIARDGGRYRLVRPLSELSLDVPQSVESLILRKLDLLTVDEQRALTHASIEGEDFTSTIVAELLGVDEVDLDERLARLAHVHHWFELVREERWPSGTVASRYRFGHALYRDYLHSRIVPKRRRQLHQRAALALIAHHGERAPEIAAQVATHFDESGDVARSVEYRILAGRKATRAFANREAIAHYSQALRTLDELPGEEAQRQRVALLGARGWRRLDAGENQEALADFRHMQTLAERVNDSAERWFALSAQAWACLRFYDREGYREPLEALLQQAEASGDPRLMAEARVHLSGMYLDFEGELVRARQQIDESMDLTRGLDHEIIAVAGLQISGALDYMQARYAACIGSYTQLIEQFTGSIHFAHDQTVVSRYEQGLSQLNLGRLSSALATFQAARAFAERVSFPSAFGTIDACIGGVYLELGHHALAEEKALAVLAMPPEHAHDYARFHAGLDLTLCRLRAPERDLAAANDSFARAQRFSEARECRCYRFVGKARLLGTQAELLLAQGEPRAAAEQARALLELAAPQHAQKHVALAHGLLAQAHEARGAHAEALSELTLALDALAETPSPRLAWRLWADRGRAALALGQTSAAVVAFEQASAGIDQIASGIEQLELRAIFSSSAGVVRARAGEHAARRALRGA